LCKWIIYSNIFIRNETLVINNPSRKRRLRLLGYLIQD
jgi:hypothetical protein